MSKQRAVVLACVVATGCVPPAWGGYPANHAATPTVAQAPAASVEVPPPPAGSLRVYVHGGGARVVAADKDDAERWGSFTIKGAGLAYADIPRFEGSAAEWQQILTCTRRYYAGLPVEIVDQQPAGGDYTLVVVGGHSINVNHNRLWGLASTGDRTVVEHGVGFVFSADHEGAARTQYLCETLSHELGHLLGLAHTDECDDLMTVNSACVLAVPRSGFQANSRAVLVSALARWRTPPMPPLPPLPLPVQLTGVSGEDSAATGLTPQLWAPVMRDDGTSASWPFSLTGPKPIARALLRYVTPGQLRGEYHCLPDGQDCRVAGQLVEAEMRLHEPGTWWMLVEVTYTDGEVRRTPWLVTSWFR